MSICNSPPVPVIGFLKPHPCPMKLTFRYDSMLNFIQVSFCFLLFIGLGSVIGLVRVQGLKFEFGFGIDNLKNILKYLIGGAANRLDIPCRQTPVFVYTWIFLSHPRTTVISWMHLCKTASNCDLCLYTISVQQVDQYILYAIINKCTRLSAQLQQSKSVTQRQSLLMQTVLLTGQSVTNMSDFNKKITLSSQS